MNLQIRTSLPVLLLTLFLINLGIAQPDRLEDKIQQFTVKMEKRPVYSTMNRYYGDLLPGVQIARWDEGYVVAYTAVDMQSRYFFLDKDFKKTTQEYVLKGKVIFQIVTDHREIAMLTGSSLVDDGDAFHNFVYFTKVNEAGQILKNTLITGANDLKKPGSTDLDNWGNPLMRWTGKFYIAFFPIQHNFKKTEAEDNDIHQADCAYIITKDGKVYSFFDWGVSHSFEQRMLVNDQYAILLSKGDGGPRGLEIDYYPLANDSFKAFEADDDPDQNNTQLKEYWAYDEDKEFACEAFNVSGKSGDNYLPFSLGDPILLDNSEVLITYSFSDQRPTHDIALTLLKPQDKDCSSGHKFLTNTPTICEHSVHTVQVAPNRNLIFWKEFDTKGLQAKIDKWQTEYEDEDDEDELIFVRQNIDRNKIGIIDNKGTFLVEPQEISKHKADWYYNIPLKDSHTPWHDIMDSYANHTRTCFVKTNDGHIAWGHHQHNTRTIEIYVY